MSIFDSITNAGGDVGGFFGNVVGKPFKGFNQGVAPNISNVPNIIQAPVVTDPGLQNTGLSQYYHQLGQDYSGNAHNTNQDQSRDMQIAFAKALQDQAAGAGPSASQTMLKNSLQQNAANTNSIIASTKGINPALAMRLAMQQNAAAQQQAQAQGVVARQQEQLAAQGQLGSNLAAVRGADVQNAGINNQLGLQYNQLGLGAATTDLNANLGTQQVNASNVMGANQINAGIAGANAGYSAGVLGGVMNGGGAVLGSALGKGGGGASAGGGGAAGAGAGAGAAGVVAMSKGGFVPGKAVVKGDSPKNDVVPVEASAGEIVIPKSHAENATKAKRFIDELMKKKGASADPVSYGKVLESHRKLKARVAALESAVGKGK